MARDNYSFKASLEEIAIIDKYAAKAHMSRSSFVTFAAVNKKNEDKYLRSEIVKTSCYLRTEINKLKLEHPGINLSGIEKGVEELWRILK